MRCYLEVSALFEAHWTGIPTVVAALAAEALKDNDIEWKFIKETIPISSEILSDMVAERSGQNARRVFERDIWKQRHVDYSEAASHKAIFTNIKPIRGFFRQEALIVYDLSPILTPKFHDLGMVSHFGNRFRRDVETSDHFFPISEATRGDIEAYFGVPRSECTILPMGIDVSPISLSTAQRIARDYTVEPYVVILGTLEPRKNGRLILDYIARNPDFAERFRIVFVGRDGWLDEREKLIRKAEESGVSRERVLFTGFVSEKEKVALIYNAAFCIYASFFEGYGLPILEAATLGKMVVCSNTSSMPEVSPAQCFFFDPSSVSELARALTCAEKAYTDLQSRVPLSLAEAMLPLSQRNWRGCYETIVSWVLS